MHNPGELTYNPAGWTALVIGKFPRRWGWLGKLLKTPFFKHLEKSPVNGAPG